MFLTTNRVSDFDEAILSRIHLTLKYRELSVNVRSQIWEHMLHRGHTSQGGATIASEETERLVKTKLNGRQVKLCCPSGDSFHYSMGCTMLCSQSDGKG